MSTLDGSYKDKIDSDVNMSDTHSRQLQKMFFGRKFYVLMTSK